MKIFYKTILSLQPLLNRGKITLLFLFFFIAFAQAQTKITWQQMGNNKNASFYDVQKDFYKKWKKKIKEMNKERKKSDFEEHETEEPGYEIFKRWESYMAPRVYPSGNMTLPSTNYSNFMSWLHKNDATPNTNLLPNNWTEIGPIGSPSGPVGSSDPYTQTGAGRINFIRFDPNNTNTWYVGAPDGGLWKSTNGGTSWTTNTDFLTVIGCSDLAIDPTNSQIMYLATGDLERNRRSIGILKSTDGGATWNTTGLTWTATDAYLISRMVMNPSNPLNMIITTTDGGTFRTTDGWSSSTQGNGFPPGFADLRDMELKPGDANTVYAAGDKFWKSTDNGVNWTQITTGLPTSGVQRIALGVSPGNNAYVYALIAKNTDQSFLGMYHSTNSGTSFSLRASTPNLLGYEADGLDLDKGQGFYDLAITVSPTNAELVTTGGVNHWQSTDGGSTWANLSVWNSGEVHADIHEISYLPGSSTTMFSCNDGGIFKSIDNGDNFVDISSNLAIAQCVGIGLSANVATTMVNGTQDNGSNFKETSTWANINGGDGGECFIDYTNNNIVYNQYVQGAFARYDRVANTNTGITTGLPSGFDFYSTWVMDPVNPNRLYVGGIPTLYTSANQGNLWTSLGTPPGSGTIKGIAVAPSNTTIIYVIKDDAISKSTNSGASFSNITATLPVGSAALSSVAVSNTDPNKVWVTFSGYSATDKVYKSTDGGITWTNISTGLPNLPINIIISVKGSSIDAVYIGADIGVYYLDNNAATWAAFNTNLPNVAVRDLEIYYPTAKLRAGTYGRGVWESDINPIIVLPIELLNFDVSLKGTNDALLKWQTASELNNKGYDIEMSQDNTSYNKMGFVQGKGTSNSLSSYETIVPNLAPGTYYFRLKIIDINGQFKYSPIGKLKINDVSTDAVRIYPNPTQDGYVFIEMLKPNSKKITVKITNAAGQLVSISDYTNFSNPLKIKLPAAGEYNVQLIWADGSTIVKKLINLK